MKKIYICTEKYVQINIFLQAHEQICCEIPSRARTVLEGLAREVSVSDIICKMARMNNTRYTEGIINLVGRWSERTGLAVFLFGFQGKFQVLHVDFQVD